MKPYKHKLGELGPEHFDGDPIDRGPLSEGARMQAEAMRDEVAKAAGLGLPKNNIQRQQEKKPKA